MKRKNTDLVEQWIRRGVLLAAEMRKHGVVMRVQMTFEPVTKPTKNRRPEHG